MEGMLLFLLLSGRRHPLLFQLTNQVVHHVTVSFCKVVPSVISSPAQVVSTKSLEGVGDLANKVT